MKKIFAAALVLLVVPFSSSAWDKLGHDVSAMIAWENMTSKAKKNISKYLEGHDDIVYYASWMDYMGYVTKSGYSNEWFDHCVPVNKDFEYAEADSRRCADGYRESHRGRLGDGKYRNLDDSTVLLLIKHLVHFLPDMHCPAHVIYNYRPSNYWVEINGRKELSIAYGTTCLLTALMRGAFQEWCRVFGTLHQGGAGRDGRRHAEGVGRR